MVVLLNAEKFNQWDQLESVLKNTGPERFFIAVSSEVPAESVQKMFLNSSRTRYVLCNTLGEEEQRAWIDSHLSINKEAASYLIDRADGDHQWMLTQIRKLRRSGLEGPTIGIDAVRALCTTQGTPDLALSVLIRDWPGVLRALEGGAPTGKDFSRVTSLLGKFVLLCSGSRAVGVTPRLLIERTGLSQKDISVFRPRALYYDSQVSTKCFVSLVKLQEGLSCGLLQAYYALMTRW